MDNEIKKGMEPNFINSQICFSVSKAELLLFYGKIDNIDKAIKQASYNRLVSLVPTDKVLPDNWDEYLTMDKNLFTFALEFIYNGPLLENKEVLLSNVEDLLWGFR